MSGGQLSWSDFHRGFRQHALWGPLTCRYAIRKRIWPGGTPQSQARWPPEGLGEDNAMGTRCKVGVEKSERAKQGMLEQQMGSGSSQYRKQRGGGSLGRCMRWSRVYQSLGTCSTLAMSFPFSLPSSSNPPHKPHKDRHLVCLVQNRALQIGAQ